MKNFISKVDIVIRTLDEEKHIEELLTSIEKQNADWLYTNVIVVDSGSTDGTLDIAEKHRCTIKHISKESFSFGRALNIGCESGDGDVIVMISGHCVPADTHWLSNLCRPIVNGTVDYTYGRQIGDNNSYFSERRIFAKYYPIDSSIPQDGFFCNNANSAISRKTWEQFPFNEELTGLEDMDVAKRIVNSGGKIGYNGYASVFHHHQETWASIRRRFEREAIALQKIMPEIHLSRFDVFRYIINSVLMDWRSAIQNSQFRRSWFTIVKYRIVQYIGSYSGNHEHRILSQQQKERYFYPAPRKREDMFVPIDQNSGQVLKARNTNK